jgi:hypothetical protein
VRRLPRRFQFLTLNRLAECEEPRTKNLEELL